MTKWEFLLFHGCGKGDFYSPPPTHKERLNELGEQRWELVGLVADQTGRVQKLYFKRPLG